ncbi:MAG: hypothetical protein ACR2K6_09300, partial [Solirubrobacterales bacterium]
IILAILIWIAVMRREVPFWLLAATLTPVGPVGSSLGIEFIERRETRGPAAEVSSGSHDEDVMRVGS